MNPVHADEHLVGMEIPDGPDCGRADQREPARTHESAGHEHAQVLSVAQLHRHVHRRSRSSSRPGGGGCCGQPAPWSCRRQRDRVPVLDEARRRESNPALGVGVLANLLLVGRVEPQRRVQRVIDRAWRRRASGARSPRCWRLFRSRRIVGEEPAGAWRDRTPPPRCRGSSAAGCAPGALRRFGHSGLTSTLVRPCSWPLTLAIAAAPISAASSQARPPGPPCDRPARSRRVHAHTARSAAARLPHAASLPPPRTTTSGS